MKIMSFCFVRYTFFYVLYPVGVTGEILVVLACMPFGREQKPLTYELPNAFNFTFSYYYFLYFALFLYGLSKYTFTGKSLVMDFVF